jgi:preprotein translocase subunit SecE
MASKDDEKNEPKVADPEGSDETAAGETKLVRASDLEPELDSPDQNEPEAEEAASPLGAQRYVHAAFLAAALVAAFVTHKVLGLAWGALAEWQAASNAIPQLLSFSEEQRETTTLIVGALAGALIVIQTYRREGIRRWADEVATELSKVTWPAREVVFNGTLVVVIASVIATVYVAVLDRFWSFLTNLVYGA